MHHLCRQHLEFQLPGWPAHNCNQDFKVESSLTDTFYCNSVRIKLGLRLQNYDRMS